MSWEYRPNSKYQYYYRFRKRAGRPIREYLGRGPKAQAAATAVQQAKDERVARQTHELQWQTAEDPLIELDTLAKLFADATLTVAGYHRQNRSIWRKRRHVTTAN
jgi:hypothetical protein